MITHNRNRDRDSQLPIVREKLNGGLKNSDGRPFVRLKNFQKDSGKSQYLVSAMIVVLFLVVYFILDNLF